MAKIRSGLPDDPEWEIEFGFPEMDNKIFGPRELAQIKAQVEEMHAITVINPAVRTLIERYWPDLVHKLPPEEA